MKRINKKLEEIIEKHKITKTNNIIYGTNIPMPNLVLPTPWKTYIKFDTIQFYFFYFDEGGITIYSVYGDDYIKIEWSAIEEFKISHVFILGKMTIKTGGNTYKFQINRFVLGCSWIPTNTRFLESKNYYYEK